MYLVSILLGGASFNVKRSASVGLELYGRHSQVGSLAGAAHLLNDSTGVLRWAQWEQKSHVDQKGKSSLDFDFQ